EYEIEGLKTLIPFHTALLATEQWARGETCRDLVEDRTWLKALAFPAAPKGDDRDAGDAVERDYTVEVSGRRFDVKVIGPADGSRRTGAAPAATAGTGTRPRPRRAERSAGGGAGAG